MNKNTTLHISTVTRPTLCVEFISYWDFSTCVDILLQCVISAADLLSAFVKSAADPLSAFVTMCYFGCWSAVSVCYNVLFRLLIPCQQLLQCVISAADSLSAVVTMCYFGCWFAVSGYYNVLSSWYDMFLRILHFRGSEEYKAFRRSPTCVPCVTSFK